jgi:hypothetical protein
MSLRLYRISKPNSRDVLMRLNEADAKLYGGVPVDTETPEPRPGIETVQLPEPIQAEPAESEPAHRRGDEVHTKLRHDVSDKARDEY